MFFLKMKWQNVSDDMNIKFLPDTQEDESKCWNLDFLMLLSFSAINSLVLTIDRTLTNIFPPPFVAGPASSSSTEFRALDVAHM